MFDDFCFADNWHWVIFDISVIVSNAKIGLSLNSSFKNFMHIYRGLLISKGTNSKLYVFK